MGCCEGDDAPCRKDKARSAGWCQVCVCSGVLGAVRKTGAAHANVLGKPQVLGLGREGAKGHRHHQERIMKRRKKRHGRHENENFAIVCISLAPS